MRPAEWITKNDRYMIGSFYSLFAPVTRNPFPAIAGFSPMAIDPGVAGLGFDPMAINPHMLAMMPVPITSHPGALFIRTSRTSTHHHSGRRRRYTHHHASAGASRFLNSQQATQHHDSHHYHFLQSFHDVLLFALFYHPLPCGLCLCSSNPYAIIYLSIYIHY